MKTLTIAYFTNRIEPKFEWFCDSICKQSKPITSEIQFLFIDLQLDYMGEERRDKLSDAVKGRFAYRHIAPKPCSWQGKHRKTKCDFFSASNTRNTAFIECKTTHIACVDDLSIVSPEWLNQVMHAVEHDYVMCGSYKKMDKMEVVDGELISHGSEYVDSRWDFGSDTGIIPCSGDLLYGCSFALPMDGAIRVNGFDEMCDGGGAEDYDFGIRLQRAGYKFYYNRNALSIESNELHSQPPMMVRRKKVCKNGEESDWFMLNELKRQPNRFNTLAQHTNIENIRNSINDGYEYPLDTLPTTDWCDDQPLSEMGEEAGNNTPKYPKENE